MPDMLDEETMAMLEKRCDDLRNQFEQYFLGTRKTPPLQERTTVQYSLRRLANQSTPNTRLRFRFQQLVAKFNSYNQYWNRTLQKIENGTYHRAKPELASGPVDKKPGAKKPGRPKSASKPGTGVSDEHIDKLYNDYVEARKKLNQSTNVSKEKLAENIKKQVPKLQKQHKDKDVQFKVVVEDGKAKLKAKLK